MRNLQESYDDEHQCCSVDGQSGCGLGERENGDGGAAPARGERVSESARAHKGSAGKKAYNEYLRTEGIKANEAVASDIAAGRMLLTGVRQWKGGKFQIAGIRADAVMDPAGGAKLDVAALEAMTPEDRDTLRAALLKMEKKS